MNGGGRWIATEGPRGGNIYHLMLLIYYLGMYRQVYTEIIMKEQSASGGYEPVQIYLISFYSSNYSYDAS